MSAQADIILTAEGMRAIALHHTVAAVIQWIFLGDLRSAIVVSANIPFALFFAIIILVLQGEDANLLSLGAVDFGIIVDSAVIMMENIYRNFQ